MRQSTSALAASNTEADVNTKKHFQRFPAAGSLNFVSMDILGQLPKEAQENLYVVFITDRYSKLMRAFRHQQHHQRTWRMSSTNTGLSPSASQATFSRIMDRSTLLNSSSQYLTTLA